MTLSRLNPNDPAPGLTSAQRCNLLEYAAFIAHDRSNAAEVTGHARDLEAYLLAHCPTYGQQRDTLAAMNQAYLNRSYATFEVFLNATQELYAFLCGR